MKRIKADREDIKRRRREWDEETERRNQRSRESEEKYRKAEYEVFAPIKEELENQLSRFKLLHFDVRVDRTYRDSIEVRIECDEREKFDELSALSWNFSVRLTSDKEVLKESGSWSGLKATTEDQLASLQESVEALKVLNRIDWKVFLDRTLPNFSDYFVEEEPRGARPDFESQLQYETIDEIAGDEHQAIAIGRGQSVGYQVVRVTPKRADVKKVYLQDDGTWYVSKYVEQMNKSTLLKNADLDDNGDLIILEI